MVKEIQRINPVGLYDPSPNGYTHVAIAPPGATIIYIAGQGGEDENGTPYFATWRRAIGSNSHEYLHLTKVLLIACNQNCLVS